MKRSLTLLLVVLMLSLTACGGSDKNDSQNSAAGDSGITDSQNGSGQAESPVEEDGRDLMEDTGNAMEDIGRGAEDILEDTEQALTGNGNRSGTLR